jgi:hypothetical protein
MKHLKCHFLEIELNNRLLYILQQSIKVSLIALSSWKAELFEQRRLRVLRDTGLVKNKNQSKMKKRAFFFFFPLVFNMEGTDTGWMTVLEKKGLHQVAGLLENYGIDSETDVSLLDHCLRYFVIHGSGPQVMYVLAGSR